MGVRSAFGTWRSTLARPFGRRRERALSITEVLVATVISVIFVGSVATVFTMTIRASDEAEAIVRANNRARAAVDRIAADLRNLRVDPRNATQTLVLRDQPLAYGDGIDNDRDGSVDEEFVDGIDEDGDFADQHAQINGTFFERYPNQGSPDLGDIGVDEDCQFAEDFITFVQLPSQTPDGRRRRITYRIGFFETQANVLLREMVIDPGLPTQEIQVDPLVFDVVSLDILAWDANWNPVGPVIPPRWVSEWESAIIAPPLRPWDAPAGVPPFPFPASFYIRVTVNAEPIPLSEIPDWPIGGRALRTESLETVVTVEATQSDARYQLYVRD